MTPHPDAHTWMARFAMTTALQLPLIKPPHVRAEFDRQLREFLAAPPPTPSPELKRMIREELDGGGT